MQEEQLSGDMHILFRLHIFHTLTLMRLHIDQTLFKGKLPLHVLYICNESLRLG